MEKGLAIIEVNDTETKGFYINQEMLEFARLNAKTKKRNAKALYAKQKKLERAEQERQHRLKEAEAKARRKASTAKAFGRILSDVAICGGVAWAGFAGLINPVIYIPVCLVCLCAACVRLGAWFGKGRK